MISPCTCPFCKAYAYVDTYIRDDKRRYRLMCQHNACHMLVAGNEHDSLEAAEKEWNKSNE